MDTEKFDGNFHVGCRDLVQDTAVGGPRCFRKTLSAPEAETMVVDSNVRLGDHRTWSSLCSSLLAYVRLKRLIHFRRQNSLSMVNVAMMDSLLLWKMAKNCWLAATGCL